MQLVQRLASRVYKTHKEKKKTQQNIEYIRKNPIELYKWLSKYHRKGNTDGQ